MRYRAIVVDLDGNVLEESEPMTQEEVEETIHLAFKMLTDTKDGHHLIIYPVDVE